MLVTQRSAGLNIKRSTVLGEASLHVTVVKLRPKSQTCVHVFLHEGPIFLYYATFWCFGQLGTCCCPDKASWSSFTLLPTESLIVCVTQVCSTNLISFITMTSLLFCLVAASMCCRTWYGGSENLKKKQNKDKTKHFAVYFWGTCDMDVRLAVSPMLLMRSVWRVFFFFWSENGKCKTSHKLISKHAMPSSGLKCKLTQNTTWF